MHKKIELLAPAGSMANLKAAISRKADAVFLGMTRFGARSYASNFNDSYLKEAINICKANNVRLFLTMNTLIKNNEIDEFFEQLTYAYTLGIDAVIIQEISFLDIIKKNYPDLRVHISTQAGIMNSYHATLLNKADRINLARELSKEEIKEIRKNYPKEIEIFCHGALCVSVSGSCLFSSLLGGRSGNRGKCAQPCRRQYNHVSYLSTKELFLLEKIPELIDIGVDSIKIEGRMRTPNYVATTTEIYREALDSHYKGKFKVTKEMEQKLHNAFNREFTQGFFVSSENILNRNDSAGKSLITQKEFYEVPSKKYVSNRIKPKVILPKFQHKSSQTKNLIVRAYNMEDAIIASKEGADIIYFDLFNNDFIKLKSQISSKLFGITPRIMLDSDIEQIKKEIALKEPDGIFAGNIGILNLGLTVPIHLDYNINIFNDIDLDYVLKKGATPIISPELSLHELKQFQNKNFIVFVHGKIKLMTLRHKLDKGDIRDQTNAVFHVNAIHNGSEILNGKELGLFSLCSSLPKEGITNFFIDTDKRIGEVTALYRQILDQKPVKDRKIKKKYVVAWFYKGVA